jgi:Uma2 family endonuclease
MVLPIEVPHYTYEDYKLWEGEWELIEGIPFAMTPSPCFEHQELVSRLIIQIGEQLLRCPKQCRIISDLDWIISEDTVLRPDISIICERPKDFIRKPPLVIFEIVSKSTAIKDEVTKFHIYEREGVKVYVLVYFTLKKARVFELEEGKYRKIGDFVEESFVFDLKKFGIDCKFKVNFKELWET